MEKVLDFTTCLSLSRIGSVHLTDDKLIENKAEGHLLHKGRTANFMLKWPSIVSYTLCRGWTDTVRLEFTSAINKVVEMNPLIAGRVFKRRRQRVPPLLSTEIRVEPGVFSPLEHPFVTHVATPDGFPSPKNLVNGDALSYIETNLVSSQLYGMKCESVAEQIKQKCPIFEAKIITLPDGFGCFCLKMSHCLGDASTSYLILDQVIRYMNRQDEGNDESNMLRKIEWEHPLKATHEVYPHTFSKRDIDRSYSVPFMIGLFAHFKRLFKPKYKVLILSREKIKQKKKELLAAAAETGENGTSPISTSEIIMAGLFQSNLSSDIFMSPIDVRAAKLGAHHSLAAGYFCTELPILKKEAINPSDLSEIINNGGSFATNEIPLLPFLQGRVGRISSLASVTTKSLFGKENRKFETICHCTPTTFLEMAPLDIAMIFRMNKNYVGVVHNFLEFRESPLLNDICI